MTVTVPACAFCGAAADRRGRACSACGRIETIALAGTAGFQAWMPAEAGASVLTEKDRGLVEARLRDPAGLDPCVVLIARQRLARCRVVPTSDIDPDVATLSSRLTYSVDGESAGECVIAGWEEGGEADLRLSIRTRRGLTLLGMREGSIATVPRRDGRLERMVLRAVLYQPERARRQAGARPVPGAGRSAQATPTADRRWEE